MTRSRLLALRATVLAFFTLACGTSPTESSTPATPDAMGTLRLAILSSCPQSLETHFALPGVGELGVVAVPGTTDFRVPVGSYSSYTITRSGRPSDVFGGFSPIVIQEGQVTVVTDLVGICGTASSQ